MMLFDIGVMIVAGLTAFIIGLAIDWAYPGPQDAKGYWAWTIPSGLIIGLVAAWVISLG